METKRTYTSAAEDAAAIRAEYKKLGWTPRMVGVRAENYSLGSAINVEVKDARVRWLQAKRIAQDIAEHIRRCEYSGEILGGGNRYVSVRFSDEYKTAMARRHGDVFRDALERARGLPSGQCANVSGLDVHVWVEDEARAFWRVDCGRPSQFHPGIEASIEDAACGLAMELEAT